MTRMLPQPHWMRYTLICAVIEVWYSNTVSQRYAHQSSSLSMMNMAAGLLGDPPSPHHQDACRAVPPICPVRSPRHVCLWHSPSMAFHHGLGSLVSASPRTFVGSWDPRAHAPTSQRQLVYAFATHDSCNLRSAPGSTDPPACFRYVFPGIHNCCYALITFCRTRCSDALLRSAPC